MCSSISWCCCIGYQIEEALCKSSQWFSCSLSPWGASKIQSWSGRTSFSDAISKCWVFNLESPIFKQVSAALDPHLLLQFFTFVFILITWENGYLLRIVMVTVVMNWRIQQELCLQGQCWLLFSFFVSWFPHLLYFCVIVE